MINVSAEFKELMKERTDFACHAQAVLADGTELTFGPESFTMSGNSLTDGAGADGLPLGAAICRTAGLSLADPEGKLDGYDFFGARIRLYLTFRLRETEERVELGTFTAVGSETHGRTVTVTACDDMYKADRNFSTTLTFPATLGALFRDVCDTCAIPYSTAEFPNSDLAVTSPPGEGYTCRQILGYIAMLAGGNARVHRDGRMEILSYDPEKAPEHELEDWIQLTPDTDDVVVTGLETTDSAGNTALEGSEGYVLTVENPLMAGREAQALAAMGTRLIGLRVRRFEGEYVAFPLAEFMDTARITDRRGNKYTSVITDVTFAFGGRTLLSDSAVSAMRNGSRYLSPEVSARIEARKLVEAERTARQAAEEALNRKLDEAPGMYGTEERQPDGSSIWYLHDKPTLAESSKVMKLTAEAIGFSTDGGKSYPYGFTVTGEMIMGVIRSEGVSADWVKVGDKGLGAVLETFVGRDENDKIVSMLNASADRINIKGNRFVLDSDNFKVAADGTVTAKGGKFAGTVDADAFTLQKAKMEIAEKQVTAYDGSDQTKDGPGGAVALCKVFIIDSSIGVYTERLYTPYLQAGHMGGGSGSFIDLVATMLRAYEAYVGSEVRVGDKVRIYVDKEGGNIRITSPDGTFFAEMDAYNDRAFRIYTSLNGKNFQALILGPIAELSYFHGTADKVAHALSFSGGAAGSYDGSAAKTVNIPLVQYGTVSVTPDRANTPKSVKVTFPKAYTAVPAVFVTPMHSNIGTTVLGASATGLSATEFTLWLTRTTTTTASVRWCAIGR